MPGKKPPEPTEPYWFVDVFQADLPLPVVCGDLIHAPLHRF
jgi:hypothetical protein